jgi:hypothetical protein
VCTVVVVIAAELVAPAMVMDILAWSVVVVMMLVLVTPPSTIAILE